jgi:predicted metal-dependent peptidase
MNLEKEHQREFQMTVTNKVEPYSQDRIEKFNKDMKTCVFGLMHKHPFFGRLSSELQPVADPTIPTAATDFKRIMYNLDFWDSLEFKERQFLIAHEILHCVFDHRDRMKTRDMGYWNMATDYAINLIIHQEGVGEMPKDKKTGKNIGLLDTRFKGMTAEKIYDILMEEQPPKQLSMDLHDIWQAGNTSDADSNTDQQSPRGNDVTGSGGQEEDTLEDRQRKLQKVAIEAMNLKKMLNGGKAGSDTSMLEHFVETLRNPRIDWRTLLSRNISSLFRSDRSWSRINRRRLDSRTVLPGLGEQPTVDIMVAMDTSGSISDAMLQDFISEVAGILGIYKQFKLRLCCWDTQVHNVQEYDFERVRELRNPSSYKIVGRGGTTTSCIWEYMKQHRIKPKQLIIFTDYDGIGSANGRWGQQISYCDPDYCPTTWIIHEESYNSEPPPFGNWTTYRHENR